MGIFIEQNKALFVYRECSYRDIFGDYHTLEYRLIFGGPAGAARKMEKIAGGADVCMLSMDTDGNKEHEHGKNRPNQGVTSPGNADPCGMTKG
jgi:hypothetical protein